MLKGDGEDDPAAMRAPALPGPEAAALATGSTAGRDDPWRLRVLYVDDSVPHIDRGSGLPRANFIVNALADLGYAVTFYPVFARDPGGDSYRDIDRSVEILQADEAEGFRRIVAEGAGRFDVLWVSRPHNIAMVCRELANAGLTPRGFVRSRVIFDSEAVFALRDFIAASMTNRFGTDAALRTAILQETRLFAQADRVVSVSEAEARLLAAFWVDNVSVLGFALGSNDDALPGFAARSGFLFIGSLAREGQPNVDSLDWLLDEAWPRVREAIPDVTLTVIGEVLPEIRDRFARPGISVLGRVADPGPLFARARVCIAPTRFAAGIPHKVYESVSRGVPLVVTALLAEQIGWPAGTGYLARDWRDATGFADALCRLHDDQVLWTRLREAGLAQIARDCDPVLHRAALRRLCEVRP